MKKYEDFIIEAVSNKLKNFDSDYDDISELFFGFWSLLEDKLDVIQEVNDRTSQDVYDYNVSERQGNKPKPKPRPKPAGGTNVVTPTGVTNVITTSGVTNAVAPPVTNSPTGGTNVAPPVTNSSTVGKNKVKPNAPVINTPT